MKWMQRLQRSFAIDIDACSKCGGKLRVIGCIEDSDVIATIPEPIRTREAAEPSQPRAPPPRSKFLGTQNQDELFQNFSRHSPATESRKTPLHTPDRFHLSARDRCMSSALRLPTGEISIAIRSDRQVSGGYSSYAPTPDPCTASVPCYGTWLPLRRTPWRPVCPAPNPSTSSPDPTTCSAKPSGCSACDCNSVLSNDRLEIRDFEKDQ